MTRDRFDIWVQLHKWTWCLIEEKDQTKSLSNTDKTYVFDKKSTTLSILEILIIKFYCIYVRYFIFKYFVLKALTRIIINLSLSGIWISDHNIVLLGVGFNDIYNINGSNNSDNKLLQWIATGDSWPIHHVSLLVILWIWIIYVHKKANTRKGKLYFSINLCQSWVQKNRYTY